MRCKDVTTRLDAYVVGEIPSALAAEVESHLASCESCRLALDRLRRLAAVLGQTPMPPVPAGFALKVMAEARTRAARRPAVAAWNPLEWWRAVSVPMRAAAAAVLVVGLLAGLAMGWATVQAPTAKLSAQAAPQGDPLAGYNLDYLGDVPSGSLADGYMALLSDRNGEGN
jgi:anti-sigma factor RsiW